MDKNNNTTIYSDEFINIKVESNQVLMETYKKGFSIEKLNRILLCHPEIEITNFSAIKTILMIAPRSAEKIGKLKERISIEIDDNNLKAYVTFSLSNDELDIKNRSELSNEFCTIVNERGIVFGINEEFLKGEIQSGKRYLFAEGIAPVNGTDAIVNMYKMEESIPEISKDDKVDFYELKLINRVKEGDWLGQKTEATEGIPGKSVKGEIIKPIKGKTAILMYDRSSVTEVSENEKTVLYSKINGAVSYQDGKICISSHLEINGDVDFKTGNIKFDGYVSIKGTVMDGFSVEATKDIEINGSLGLGCAKNITSTHGSIFIKGGIASRGKAEIKAAKNIFTKFIDDTVIVCGETLHVGFYCINSSINAKQVIIDSSNGHIIGGNISAQVRVVAPFIGSEMEKRTIIEISGFDREALKKELDGIFHKISELKNEQQSLKQLLSRSDNNDSLDAFQKKEFNLNSEKLYKIKDQVKELDDKRKSIAEYLKTRGDGEIFVTTKIYPNCTLILKNSKVEINTVTSSTSYYIQDGILKQI